jgi:hypothetical protein
MAEKAKEQKKPSVLIIDRLAIKGVMCADWYGQ